MSTLLVCGFNTYETDTYDVLMKECPKITLFQYKSTENFEDVLERLGEEVQKYTILIGHSMGGFLLSKLIEADKLTDQKVILSQPFLETPLRPLWRIVPKSLSLPRMFVIPRHKLSEKYTLKDTLSDKTMLPIGQLRYAFKYLPNMLEVLTYPNLYIILSENDKVCTYSKQTLDFMFSTLEDRFCTLECEHEPFAHPEYMNKLKEYLIR